MTDPSARAEELIRATAGVNLVPLLADPGPLREVLEAIATPELEVNLFGPDAVLQQQFHGVDGFIAAWRDWSGPFSELSWYPQDGSLVRGNRMVNFVEQRGVIAGTTGEVSAQSAALWHFDADGQVVRIDFHLDRDLAVRTLEELG